MMTLGALLLVLVIVSALYAFGVFRTPYFEAFRLAFYFFLLAFIVAVGIGVVQEGDYGYDPTPRHEGAR